MTVIDGFAASQRDPTAFRRAATGDAVLRWHLPARGLGAADFAAAHDAAALLGGAPLPDRRLLVVAGVEGARRWPLRRLRRRRGPR